MMRFSGCPVSQPVQDCFHYRWWCTASHFSVYRIKWCYSRSQQLPVWCPNFSQRFNHPSKGLRWSADVGMRLGCQTPKGTPFAQKRQNVGRGHFPTPFMGLTYIWMSFIVSVASLQNKYTRLPNMYHPRWVHDRKRGKLVLKKIICSVSSFNHWHIERWDQISSTHFETHIIIYLSYPWPPSIGNQKKNHHDIHPRWKVRSVLKSSTFGTSSRPKIFKASRHVQVPFFVNVCWCLINNPCKFKGSVKRGRL